MVPDIVNGCTSCRAWSNSPPAPVASVELADTVNQQADCDLRFVFDTSYSMRSTDLQGGTHHGLSPVMKDTTCCMQWAAYGTEYTDP